MESEDSVLNYEREEGANGTPLFEQSTRTWDKDQVENLVQILNLNGQIFSKALSVALSQNMWPEISQPERSIFIVQMMERVSKMEGATRIEVWPMFSNPKLDPWVAVGAGTIFKDPRQTT